MKTLLRCGAVCASVMIALGADVGLVKADEPSPKEGDDGAPPVGSSLPPTAPEPPSHGAEGPPPVRRTAFDGSIPIGGQALRKGLPELTFPASYVRINAADWGIMVVGGATALAMAIVPPFASHRRSGGVLFDEDVRSVLRAPSFEGRYLARDTSDVLLSLFVTYPFFVDSLATAWWFRGNAEAARQMALINAEGLALVGAVQGITNVFFARERPYGRDCGGIVPEGGFDCSGTGRYRSFFSGHAAYSFAAASLMCSHHMNLDLFANPTADVMSCIVGYLAAAATASLRVVGDMHYASDVITGSLVGTAIGLGVPWLHYHGGARKRPDKPSAFQLQVVPTGLGASIGGTF